MIVVLNPGLESCLDKIGVMVVVEAVLLYNGTESNKEFMDDDELMNLKSAPEGLCGLELDSMSVDNGGNCLSLFRCI